MAEVKISDDEITIDDLIRCQKSYLGGGSYSICPTCRFYGRFPNSEEFGNVCASRLIHKKTIEILEKVKEKGEY